MLICCEGSVIEDEILGMQEGFLLVAVPIGGAMLLVAGKHLVGDPFEGAVGECEILKRMLFRAFDVEELEAARVDALETDVPDGLNLCELAVGDLGGNRVGIYSVHDYVGKQDVLDERGLASVIGICLTGQLDNYSHVRVRHHDVGEHAVPYHSVVDPTDPDTIGPAVKGAIGHCHPFADFLLM